MPAKFLLSIFLFILFIFTACSKNDIATKPNIIWLVAEDISPALGCYGDDFATTPHIDALAARGIVYDNAFATAPICAPSRSCLMSGLYATSLGTQHLRCEIAFPEQLQTLPELLSQAGYFTSNRDKTDYNFDPQNRWEHWSSTTTPWRERDGNRPFFSFINIGPSHEGSVNNEKRFADFTKDLDSSVKHDPAHVNVPPYYPDNESARLVWAHYYDIMTVLDQNVGAVIDSLEKDGLMENTIIFFFGDHGFGMPRYKRWLYKTGLHIPLIVYVPKAYRKLCKKNPGTHNPDLVSFVDFVPTVLNLAGVEIPPDKEGQPFLGLKTKKREYVFGARDRADDMYEMSRAVSDGRYIYIRHFMPHLPYIQSGYIYSDVKHAFRVLRTGYKNGELNAEQLKMWQPKPVEELYDWSTDPKELNNLAGNPDYLNVQTRLAKKLHSWMIDFSDLGLLPEAEYMIRGEENSPYEYSRESGGYQVEKILQAAEMVGTADEEALVAHLADEESGVRYWAVMGLRQLENVTPSTLNSLLDLLHDPCPSVQILAAEVLCHFGDFPPAVERLGKWVQDDRPWLAMQAARSVQLVGEDARPLISVLYQVLYKNLAEPGGRRKYKDFNYAAFTSWALEWALQELGEDIKVN